MKKKSVLFIFLLVVVFAIFSVDIGINGRYFIRRDVRKAFVYRITGDCESFAWFTNKDTDKWKSDCETENNQSYAIRDFEIKNIAYNSGSDKAFVHVELTRNDLKGRGVKYPASYVLKKIDGIWKIDENKR